MSNNAEFKQSGLKFKGLVFLHMNRSIFVFEIRILNANFYMFIGVRGYRIPLRKQLF